MSNVAQSSVQIQQESIQTGNPTSESMFASLGGAINYLLANAPQIGDLQASVLNQTQFQSLRGTNWVLADGRDVTGSQYQTVTGSTTIPDFRGTYPRASDNGGSARGARGLDPNGTKAPGSYVADQFASHSHSINNILSTIGSGASTQPGYFPSVNGSSTNATGGTETAPKTTYWNIFVKIN